MNTQQTVTNNETKARQGGKFLTFCLAEEEYGIEILKVQEIIGMLPITRVPRSPRFICGVINLRGKIIPVTDLRQKFGMPTVAQTAETCIIVVAMAGIEIGVMVDKVSEVLDIAASEVEDVPSFGTEVPSDYLLGIGKVEGNVKLLLNIDRILSVQEAMQIKSETIGAEAAEMSFAA